MDKNKIEAETNAALEADMVAFCEKQGIVRGWSVANHAKFQFQTLADIIDSNTTGDGMMSEETKFRVFLVLRKTANYSAWRQAHEGEGKPLAAGVGRGGKSLAAEYEDSAE